MTPQTAPATSPQNAAVRPYETCRAAFAVQDPTLPANTFRGLASVFGTLIDAWIPTRILPGAFTETLADPSQRARVKVLWQHSDYEPIGIPTSMQETADGLAVDAKISETMRGKDALILMRDRVITEISIGFDPIEWHSVLVGGQEERHITKLRLWEFSLVTFAANRDALIQTVNSRQAPAAPSPFRAVLDQALTSADTAQPIDEQLARFLADPANGLMTAGLAKLEIHAGRVLSAENLTLVTDARNALDALIQKANASTLNETESRLAADRARQALQTRLRMLGLQERALKH